MKRILRGLAVGLAALGGLSSLPLLIAGALLLSGGVRLYVSKGPYFQYTYITSSVLWLTWAAVGISAAAFGVLKRTYYGILPLLSLAFGLMSIIALPDIGPGVEMMVASTKLLGHADQSLALWDERHGSFPQNDEELRDALAARPLGERPIYFRDGKPISYHVQLVKSASGATLESVPPLPGTLVYSVNSDYNEYWLSMTTLQDPVSGPVVFHRVGRRGKPWVMKGRHHNPGEPQQSFVE